MNMSAEMDPLFNTRVISVFNHKGGVGKTTASIAVGWKLASRGKKVLLIDADPQCNITGFLVDPGYELGVDELSYIDWNTVDDPLKLYYERYPTANIRAALAPLLSRSECERLNLTFGGPLGTSLFQVKNRIEFLPEQARPQFKNLVPQPPDGLFLLAGHPEFADYEAQINSNCENYASAASGECTPGCFLALLRGIQLAQGNNPFDFILYDLSPGASCTNKVMVMSSEFLFSPCSMDYYSYLAAGTLCRLLVNWNTWYTQVVEKVSHRIPEDSLYYIWKKRPIFLGRVFQRYTVVSGGVPARTFLGWKRRIDEIFDGDLWQRLDRLGMALPLAAYEPLREPGVRNYQSLGAVASRLHIPVFEMTSRARKFGGRSRLCENDERNILPDVNATFEALADHFVNPCAHVGPQGLAEAYEQQEAVRKVLQYSPWAPSFPEYSKQDIRKKAASLEVLLGGV
eukprot:Rmarinus@m.13970